MASCPRCGADASGNFCSTCGASLKQNLCPTCGATPEPGARFCNNCGSPLGAARATSAGAAAGLEASAAPASSRKGGGASRAKKAAGVSAEVTVNAPQSQLGWWVAGIFFIGMILILALPILRRDAPPEEATAPATGTDAGRPPDLSTMTPRQAADRLFDRIMRASSAGNTAEVQQFLPMGIAAYENARPLDLDGLFHLSQLHQTAGDYATALAVAQELLAQNPDHLLGLSSAADAAKAMGQDSVARAHYFRFLEVYDTEMAKGLEEYGAHPNLVTQARQDAIDFTRP